MKKRLVVKRIEAVLHIVQDEIVPNHRARGHERLGTHVARIVAKCEVDAINATNLTALIVQAVERSGRRAVACRNLDAVFHENVEHTRGELTAEATALQNDCNLPSVFRLVLHRSSFHSEALVPHGHRNMNECPSKYGTPISKCTFWGRFCLYFCGLPRVRPT